MKVAPDREIWLTEAVWETNQGDCDSLSLSKLRGSLGLKIARSVKQKWN